MADVHEQQRNPRPADEKARLRDNVREHARAEKALETERDFLSAVLDSADAFIIVLDNAGRILQVNRAVELATGYSEDDLRAREFVSALPIPEAAASLSHGLRDLSAGGGAHPFETHWVKTTGERLLVAGSLTPLRAADGVLQHVIITASDITQTRALEDTLRTLSLLDDMTGLCNRRGFMLLAGQRLKESRRSGSTLTLIYADVDGLKAINDDFGHSAGDIALTLSARALEATFRESDVVARVGGDEFVVMSEADTRDLGTVKTRLDRELGRRAAESGLQFAVSLTIGSAHSGPLHERSLDDLLQQADDFMYEHKHREPPNSE
jgi:diguanylate cyclase (GGDEF)-like protein/PAS domain S-box-containing protein